MNIIIKRFGRIYVIKFLKFLKIPSFLSFLVLNCIGNMCLFVEKKKKEKSVVFNLTYNYLETTYTIFSTSSTPFYSNPPIINNYYNVQPPPQTLLFRPLLLFGTREYIFFALRLNTKRCRYFLCAAIQI